MGAIDRRSLLKGAAGAAALACCAVRTTPARAAEFSLKFGADWPSEHPSSVQARKACDQVREHTGGRVEIQYFANNSLGGDTDMLSQVRGGALELMAVPTGVLSTLVPLAAINNTGFAFDSYDQVWQAMDGKLGALIRSRIEKINLAVYEKIWDNGFRQITTGSTPINGLADLKGLKIRVPVAPIYISMMRGLGCSPASANINELYSSLQTKVFDGEENTWANIQFFKLYEVQKNVAVTNHMWEGFWIVGNKRALAALPADLGHTVTEVMNSNALEQRTAIAKFADTVRDQLKGEGMALTEPPRPPFREALAKSGFYAEWKHTFGDEAWDLLEATTGKLG